MRSLQNATVFLIPLGVLQIEVAGRYSSAGDAKMPSKTRWAKKASYPKHPVSYSMSLYAPLMGHPGAFQRFNWGHWQLRLKTKCYFVWPLKSKDIKSASDYLRGLSEQPHILHTGSLSRWLTLDASFPDLVRSLHLAHLLPNQQLLFSTS